MVHCCLTSIIFAVKKNTFLHSSNVFSKSKSKKQIWTIAVNVVTLAPNHGFSGSFLFNIVEEMSPLSLILKKQKYTRAR